MNVAAGRAPAGRRFTLALAAPLLALSLPAEAQPNVPPTVAVLSFHSPDVTAPIVSALRQGLEERGWVDGRSMRLVSYAADGRRLSVGGARSEQDADAHAQRPKGEHREPSGRCSPMLGGCRQLSAISHSII
jgi:hypothetical protein